MGFCFLPLTLVLMGVENFDGWAGGRSETSARCSRRAAPRRAGRFVTVTRFDHSSAHEPNCAARVSRRQTCGVRFRLRGPWRRSGRKSAQASARPAACTYPAVHHAGCKHMHHASIQNCQRTIQWGASTFHLTGCAALRCSSAHKHAHDASMRTTVAQKKRVERRAH